MPLALNLLPCEFALLDKAHSHFFECQREEEGAEKGEVEQVPQGEAVEGADGDGPGDFHQVGQRQEPGQGLGPRGKRVEGEEGPAEEKHGRDEEEDGQVEQVDVANDGREVHPDRREGEPGQKGKRDEEQALGVADEAEEADNGEHDGRCDHGFGGAPYDLAGDDFLEEERGGQHGVEGLLVVHPHVRAVGGLEEAVVHHVDGEQGRRDEYDVGSGLVSPGDVSHERTHPQAEGRKVKQRLQQGRHEAHLPGLAVDREVALPDAEKPRRDDGHGCPAHSRSSLPVSFRKTSSRVAVRRVQPSRQ